MIQRSSRYNKLIFDNKDGISAISSVFQLKNGIEYDSGSGSVFKDLEAFANYKTLVEGNTSAQDAFNQCMLNATPAAQEYVRTTDALDLNFDDLHAKLKLQNYEFQAQNHSLSSTRKILNEYNKGVKAGTKDQTNLTKAVKKGNVALGDYLENLDDGKEASMFGFLAQSAGDTMVDIIGNFGTSLLNAGVSALVSWAISAGVQLIDTLIVTAEEAKKGMSDAFAEYDSAKEKVASVKSEIEETQARIDALNAKGGLTLIEKGELEGLKDANKLLKIQQDLAEKEAKSKAISAGRSAVLNYDKNYQVITDEGRAHAREEIQTWQGLTGMTADQMHIPKNDLNKQVEILEDFKKAREQAYIW